MNALLEIRDLHAHYGAAHVLHGVDLDVGESQVVALFGRNGAGKTTLVHSIMGLLEPTSGSVRFDGNELVGEPPHRIARHGIGLVPQGRRIFPTLNVEENLTIAFRSRSHENEWTIERVYDLLPRLAERRRVRGRSLSGGEQQMLAIGRALLGNPRIILLDEPSEGLAPLLVEEVGQTLDELRSEGIPALLVEQNLGLGLELADEVYIMVTGEIAYRGATEDFRRDPGTARDLLGVR